MDGGRIGRPSATSGLGAICALCWLPISLALGAQDAKTLFSVADSIEQTRIADPDMTWPNFGLASPEFNWSPTNREFLVVTRKGNLSTGRNEYTLLLYRVGAIRQFLSAKSAPLPQPEALATFETASTWPAIDKVRWLPDGKGIAFIGRGVDQVGQVFLYNLQSKVNEQLTHSAHNVVEFGLSAAAETVVYAALTPPDWTVRNQHGYTVGAEGPASLAWIHPEDAVPEVRYFALHSSDRKAVPLQVEHGQYLDRIFVAPSGREAIILSYAIKVPAAWQAYKFVRDRIDAEIRAGIQASASDVPNEAFGAYLQWLPRALLFDTFSGKARSLLDAPLGQLGSSVRAIWSEDGNSVVLGPTYLPLSAFPASRADGPGIAEVNTQTGDVKPIASLPAEARLTGLMIAGDCLALHLTKMVPGGQLASIAAEKTRGRWRTRQGDCQKEAGRPLSLSVVQGMNTPFDLAAADRATDAARTFTELNPQLRNKSLGLVNILEWSDTLGRSFRGGIVYPPNYDAGKRYPVVIQGSGFSEKNFSTDGAAGLQGAYAAQALANRGIVVLQLPSRPHREAPPQSATHCEDWLRCGESPKWVLMLESAIDALDARGILARDRVGVIGFSRVGMWVHHALAFSRYKFAAATIADSISASPLTYSFVYSYPYPGMLEFEDDTSMGASFWSDGVNNWQGRSPVFHLDRVQTPLRLEFYGKGLSAYWDTFAILKRHRRPVELIHIPLDVHVLQTPFGRQTSLQGNVDWFRFWLLDEEDADPAKADQYARWRQLRRQHRENQAE